MSNNDQKSAIFTEDVEGIHTSYVMREDGTATTLTIVESGGEYVTYLAGRATGNAYNDLNTAMAALLKQSKRETGILPKFKRSSPKTTTIYPAHRLSKRSPVRWRAALAILALLILVVGTAAALRTLPSAEQNSALSSRQTDLNTRITVRNSGKTGRTLTLRELLNE